MGMSANPAFVSRWGAKAEALLGQDTGYVTIPGFVLRHLSQFRYQGSDERKLGQVVGISHVEFHFMAIVQSFRFDTAKGVARPTIRTIAERMGCSRITVQRARSSLVEKGALRVKFSTGWEGNRYSFEPLADQCVQFERARLLAESQAELEASENPRSEATDEGNGYQPSIADELDDFPDDEWDWDPKPYSGRR